MRILILLVIVYLSTSCIGGGGGGGSGSSNKKAPDITGITISPLQVRFSGGDITVDASVTDNDGVSSVVIEVAGTVNQNVAASNSSGDNYTAVVSLPANEDLFEIENDFTLTIRATDAKGNIKRTLPYTVTVEAMRRPPAPPINAP